MNNFIERTNVVTPGGSVSESWIISGKRLTESFLEEYLGGLEETLHDVSALRRALYPCRRLRSSLYIAVSQAAGRPISLQRSLSLQFLHTASIIVDDFLDEDDARRHIPNSMERSGTVGLLTSHELIALMLRDLIIDDQHRRDIADAYVRMIRGEYSDVFSTRPRGRSWLDQYENQVLDKTKPLFEYALRWALDSEMLPHARDIGSSIGVAFQLSNDLYDMTAAGRETRYLKPKEHYPLSLTFPLAFYLDRTQDERFIQSSRPYLSYDEMCALLNDICESGVREAAHQHFTRFMEDLRKRVMASEVPGVSLLLAFLDEIQDFSIWTKDYEQVGGQNSF